MHLATSTTDLHINYTMAPEPDTYCPEEAAALLAVVAATHLGGPLLPTVQSAVVHAKMVHQQNWTSEAHKLLADFGFSPQGQPLMTINH
jgi:hypothetical protein